MAIRNFLFKLRDAEILKHENIEIKGEPYMAKEINVLSVEGMSCSHCENTIKRTVGELNGVESVSVDLKGKKVTVEYESEKVSLGTIKGIIEDYGYNVK